MHAQIIRVWMSAMSWSAIVRGAPNGGSVRVLETSADRAM